MIIGLIAEGEHGKTTIAEYLCKEKGFLKASFAAPLKEMLVNAGLCTPEEVYTKKTVRSRYLMQKIGTEIFRKQVDPLFWINKMHKVLIRYTSKSNIVIDDIRFPNEAGLVKSLGGILVKVVRLNADGTKYEAPELDSSHDSEKNVSIISCDFTLEAKTGDIASLITGIRFIVQGR